MNKKSILTIIILFNFAFCFSTEFVVAKIVYIDETKESSSVDLSLRYQNNIATSLADEDFNKQLTVKTMKGLQEAPISVMEVKKYVALNSCDLLIYGFIKKTETSFQTELKLYNIREEKNIKSFFASDDVDHFNRLCDTISRNIIEFLHSYIPDSINIETVETRFPELFVPVNLGWWFYAGNNEGRVLVGIIEAVSGVEFEPGIVLYNYKNLEIDLSFRFNIGYKSAANKSKSLPTYLHSLTLSFPGVFDFKLYDVHGVHIGLGPMYEMQFINHRPLYESTKFIFQNAGGLILFAEYTYDLNELLVLEAGLKANFYFSTDPSISIYIGTKFHCF